MTAVLNGVAALAEVAEGPEAVANVVNANALATALGDALNFVAPERDKIPVLSAVRLEAGGGNLVAVATDRFTIGVSRVDYAGEAFAATLDLADVKRLVALAKCRKRDAAWREVVIVVEPGSLAFRFTTGEALTVCPRQDEYPSWRSLIPADDRRMGAVVGVAYDPMMLARFAKVRPGAERRMTLFAGMSDNRLCLTVVSIGEDFVGAVMPLRAIGVEERYVRPLWLAASSAGRGT